MSAVDVAPGLDGEVEQPVLRKERQHVIEERHAGFDLRRAATINRQRERDVGLRGFAGDGAYALGVFSHASSVSLRTHIS